MGWRRDVDVARGRARVSSRPVESPLPAPPPATPDRQLARAVEAERTLREITSEQARQRDPAAVRSSRPRGRAPGPGRRGDLRATTGRRAAHGASTTGSEISSIRPTSRTSRWRWADGLTAAPWPSAGCTMREDLIDAFPRVPESDHFFEVSGFRSLLAAPIASATELYGALEVYATREHAFDEADAALLEAFAAQAAIAFENARLIAELEKARGEAARRADEERTLREISGRVTAIVDPVEVLQAIVHEAPPLASDVAAISLNRSLAGQFVFSEPVMEPDPADGGVPDGRPFDDLPGLWGRALAAGGPVATDDYLADETFIHDPVSDARVARDGLRSAAAAPIPGDPRMLGSLQVASARPGAFGPHELELLGALANQAASAIATALRVADLAASRVELAKRAEVERSLREIAARVSASHDVDVVVGLAIEEATRLVGGDLARVDVYEPAIGLLRGSTPPTRPSRPPGNGRTVPAPAPTRASRARPTRAARRSGPATTWPTTASPTARTPTRTSATSGSAPGSAPPSSARVGRSAPSPSSPPAPMPSARRRPTCSRPSPPRSRSAWPTPASSTISIAPGRSWRAASSASGRSARSAAAWPRSASRSCCAGSWARPAPHRADGSHRLLDESTMRLRWALADGATADADPRSCARAASMGGRRRPRPRRGAPCGPATTWPDRASGRGRGRPLHRGDRSAPSSPRRSGFGRPLGTSRAGPTGRRLHEADADCSTPSPPRPPSRS